MDNASPSWVQRMPKSKLRLNYLGRINDRQNTFSSMKVMWQFRAMNINFAYKLPMQ